MSGTTISNLPAAAGAITTDLVPVVEVGSPNVTKRLTIAQFLASVLPLAGGTLTGTLTVSVGGVVVSAGGLTVSAGGAAIAGDSNIIGNLGKVTAAQFGSLSVLNSGSGCVVVESVIGTSTPAVYAFNRTNSPGATSMIVRNDRTDGVSVVFQFGASTVGSITQDGSTTSFNTTSDASLKTRIGSIEFTDAAKVIDKLAALWFTWKTFTDHEPEPGFFAQEVYKVCPWAVTKGRGKSGSKHFRPWQMDASKLMPFVVAYIQGLGRRVDELERKL